MVSEAGGEAAGFLSLHDIPKPGERTAHIGGYEILETIAHGGMGVVYRAREPRLNRVVALKMLAGGRHASDAYKRRFRQEAKTAAQLNHPNIVSIFEVGEHEDQPYFTMEYVAGADLARLTRDQPLPPKRAAEYVQTVAKAVHHAHHQGVLHRDLKPSNILIGTDGRPRVSDFGLARQMDVESSLTMSGEALGTPGYLPPEQVSVKHGAVSPASDVYALGAVLYHLLTGRPPFLAGSVAETLQQVLEADPVPLRRLSPAIPQDLETICLKCLEKDPRRRYPSAQEVADDLDRYLEGKPIRARPIRPHERLVKWYRRSPGVAWLTTTVLVVFLAGFAATFWQWRSARQAAVRSAHIVAFLTQMLAGVRPAMALGLDTKLLEKILADSADRARRELAGDPPEQAFLLDTIGTTYRELGQADLAEQIFREELALRARFQRTNHPNAVAALFNLATVLGDRGRYSEAEALHREALALRERNSGARSRPVFDSLLGLGEVLVGGGRYSEAETIYQRALALARELFGEPSVEVAKCLNNLGLELQQVGRLPESEARLREALAMFRQVLPSRHPDMAAVLSSLGDVLYVRQQLAEAETLHREALSLRTQLLPPEHPQLAESVNNVGLVLLAQGRFAEAETNFVRVLTLLEDAYGPEHPHVAFTLNNLAGALEAQGRFDEAEARHRESLALRRKVQGEQHSDIAITLHNLATVLARARKLNEAEAVQRDALSRRKLVLGEFHPDYAASLDQLAKILALGGKLSEAEPVWLLAGLSLAGVSSTNLGAAGLGAATAKLSTAIEADPTSPALRLARGYLRGRLAQWQGAVDDLEKSVELQRRIAAFPLAPLQLHQTNLLGYSNVCAHLIELAQETRDAPTAAATALALLLRPEPGWLPTAGAMADLASQGGTNQAFAAKASLVKGLAELRQGRFEPARDWAQRSLDAAGTDASTAAAAGAVLAMSQQRLGATGSARKPWDEAARLADSRLTPGDGGDRGEDWPDRLVASLLVEEASERFATKAVGEGHATVGWGLD